MSKVPFQRIDIAATAVQLLDALFEARRLAAADAEHPKERIQEALGVGVFVLGVLPFVRKSRGAIADFVPTEWLRLSPGCDSNTHALPTELLRAPPTIHA
jgi:hypothetical protein